MHKGTELKGIIGHVNKDTNKELENLLEDLDGSYEEVKTRYGVCYAYSPDIVEELRQAILELKVIKESNPSEALEELKELHELAYGNEKTSWKIDDIRMSSHIKQALLKAQETEKENVELKRAIEIIMKKFVEISLLKASSCLEDYNNEMINVYGDNFAKRRILTQEEFECLKKYKGE